MSTLNKDKVITILKKCFDPEIPIDLWNLGLIYEININEVSKEVKIVMSLTTPGCTMGQYMADDIRTKLESLPDIKKADVQVVFDPPWEPQMMTDEGKKKLGFSTSNKKGNDNTTTNKEWE